MMKSAASERDERYKMRFTLQKNALDTVMRESRCVKQICEICRSNKKQKKERECEMEFSGCKKIILKRRVPVNIEIQNV